MTAESLSSHADWFLAKHTQAQETASQVVLGAGKSTAALPAMVREWQAAGQRFAARHVKHADGHRVAAEATSATPESDRWPSSPRRLV
jgi:hypothetical protein